jgi:hypothetical protein
VAASARARAGDLAHAVRDLREGAERTHQAGTPSGFYMGVWSGSELLTALDRYGEAAVFDGIVSTGYPAESRTGAGLSHQRAAIVHAASGPEQYDAAFQTGAVMTYEQAVEHTLRVLDDLINETDNTS